MLQLVFWIGVVALVGYFLRWNFRRAWSVRALKNSAEKGEAKKEASKIPADAVGK
jgi:hypothetical protein